MTTERPLRFERTTCTRCSGSGKHSWCEQWQDRCFKCNGKGEQLTRRGAETSRWLSDRLAGTVGDVNVGDRIKVFSDTFTVAAIERNVALGVGRYIDGVCVWLNGDEFTTFDGFTHKYETTQQITFKATDADRTAAAEYQDTLTKAGKPRKRA